MPLGICRLIRVSFDTKLSAILIFRGIHFGHTAEVNFAEAIVYEKTIVSAFSAVSATSAEFTWPFTRVSDKCVKELRNSKLDLNLPLLKTSFGQKSFSFRGAKLWNKLGSEAKTTSSFSAFKKAVTQN